MEVELATPSYFLQVNLIIKLFIIKFQNLIKGNPYIYYEGTIFAWSETDNLFAEFNWKPLKVKKKGFFGKIFGKKEKV